MRNICFLLAVLLLSSACYDKKKEDSLRRKEIELSQKEQELLLKEKTLQIKEQELSERVKLLDTNNVNQADTAVFNEALVGNWAVKMTCTETSCPGSAIGDTKNEQWEIGYQNDVLIAKATVRGKLVRVYSGISTARGVELVARPSEEQADASTRMVVRMQLSSNGKLIGIREILRSGDCRIVYALELSK